MTKKYACLLVVFTFMGCATLADKIKTGDRSGINTEIALLASEKNPVNNKLLEDGFRAAVFLNDANTLDQLIARDVFVPMFDEAFVKRIFSLDRKNIFRVEITGPYGRKEKKHLTKSIQAKFVGYDNISKKIIAKENGTISGDILLRLLRGETQLVLHYDYIYKLLENCDRQEILNDFIASTDGDLYGGERRKVIDKWIDENIKVCISAAMALLQKGALVSREGLCAAQYLKYSTEWKGQELIDAMVLNCSNKYDNIFKDMAYKSSDKKYSQEIMGEITKKMIANGFDWKPELSNAYALLKSREPATMQGARNAMYIFKVAGIDVSTDEEKAMDKKKADAVFNKLSKLRDLQKKVVKPCSVQEQELFANFIQELDYRAIDTPLPMTAYMFSPGSENSVKGSDGNEYYVCGIVTPRGKVVAGATMLSEIFLDDGYYRAAGVVKTISITSGGITVHYPVFVVNAIRKVDYLNTYKPTKDELNNAIALYGSSHVMGPLWIDAMNKKYPK